MIKDRIDFDGGEPAYVEIRCDGKRLDDPGGQMHISDIGFEQGHHPETGSSPPCLMRTGSR